MASAALGLGARRDAELPQPAADGAAAHPEPLADLHRGQPLLLVKPAQLGGRNAAAHSHRPSPTAPRCVVDTGWSQRARESPRANESGAANTATNGTVRAARIDVLTAPPSRKPMPEMRQLRMPSFLLLGTRTGRP